MLISFCLSDASWPVMGESTKSNASLNPSGRMMQEQLLLSVSFAPVLAEDSVGLTCDFKNL